MYKEYYNTVLNVLHSVIGDAAAWHSNCYLTVAGHRFCTLKRRIRRKSCFISDCMYVTYLTGSVFM